MFEWDQTKSEETRKARGFGFEIVDGFNWNFAVCAEVQFVDGEERELWLGPIENSLFALVVAERVNAVRVISLRLATKQETKDWKRAYEEGP